MMTPMPQTTWAERLDMNKKTQQDKPKNPKRSKKLNNVKIRSTVKGGSIGWQPL